MIDTGLLMYVISAVAITVAWAVMIRLDRPHWRIITGRLGLLLGIVTVGFQFFVFRR